MALRMTQQKMMDDSTQDNGGISAVEDSTKDCRVSLPKLVGSGELLFFTNNLYMLL